MSETETYQPGRYEAKALFEMNEVERPTRRPRRHVVVHQETPGTYRAYAWSAGTARWEPDARLHAGAARIHAMAFLEPLLAFDNVTMTDERIDFAELDGFGLEEFDDCGLHPARTVLCQEGVPNAPDQWASVGVGRAGAAISGPGRFPKVSLLERFRNAAFHQPGVLKAPTVLVRHDVAARDLVSKECWGIVGRPDLMARQVDQELRQRQEQAEHDARAWETPNGRANMVRQQQIEMQKKAEWAAARR